MVKCQDCGLLGLRFIDPDKELGEAEDQYREQGICREEHFKNEPQCYMGHRIELDMIPDVDGLRKVMKRCTAADIVHVLKTRHNCKDWMNYMPNRSPRDRYDYYHHRLSISSDERSRRIERNQYFVAVIGLVAAVVMPLVYRFVFGMK